MVEKMNANKVRVLIVDDDRAIRRFLRISLSGQGFAIAEAVNGEEALRALNSFRPDVVILDLGLPDADGIEITRHVRERVQTPIIVLSVREKDSDKISALNAGADDYLTKPFSLGELLARVRAVLRRFAKSEDEPVFKTGNLTADLSNRVVKVGEREIHLTPTEYDVLKMFVLNAGRVLTHHQLMKQVWNKNMDNYEGTAHLVRVTVSNLRSKIEPDPDRPTFVVTEPGIGYRLLADS